MLNELIRGKYKAVSLYISDDYQALHQVPQEYIRELVQGIEIEFNAFRHSVICALMVNHALIKNTIGKEPDRLNDKNIFRIVIIDSQDFRIDRTFICVNAERQGQGDRSGDMYELLLEDSPQALRWFPTKEHRYPSWNSWLKTRSKCPMKSSEASTFL